MKIAEREEQRLVISSTFKERFLGGFVAAFGIIFVSIFLSVTLPKITMDPQNSLLNIVPLVFIYIGLRMLIGKKIIFDKSTDSILVESPSFTLLQRKHQTILFSDVNGVEITYKRISRGQGGSSDGWLVSILTEPKGIKIDHTSNKDDMLSLAEEISNFMGKVLVEDSEKKGNWFTRFFNLTG